MVASSSGVGLREECLNYFIRGQIVDIASDAKKSFSFTGNFMMISRKCPIHNTVLNLFTSSKRRAQVQADPGWATD